MKPQRLYSNVISVLTIIFALLCWTYSALAEEWHAVPYESITLSNEKLVYPPKGAANHWHIDSEKDFLTFIESTKTNGYELGHIPIDFSKKTLLGQYATEMCCHFKIVITQNDKTKKIKMGVQVVPAICEKVFIWRSFNLILVPKIPSDYEVIFTRSELTFEGGVKSIKTI